jgi:hypothetical protein
MKYKFEFTLEEVKVILAGLGKLPYEQVANFIETLIKDFNSQEKPKGGK